MAAITTAIIGLIFVYIFGTTPFANQSNNQPQTPVQNQQIVHSQPNWQIKSQPIQGGDFFIAYNKAVETSQHLKPDLSLLGFVP